MLSSHDECKFTFIHVYILIPFFLTHLLNFGHSHVDVGTHYQVYFCSVRKIVWLLVHYLYCTICTCCYLCVCVSCSKATAFPYCGTTICWPKLKSHTQTLHHGLRNTSFKLQATIIHPDILPDHPRQQSHLLPGTSRPKNLSSSRHNLRIHRCCIAAQESLCVFFRPSFAIH